MNQISIKSCARNIPEVKIRRKITRTRNNTSGKLYFVRGTILFFGLHASFMMHFEEKSFRESYLVQFSVSHKMPFFAVS